MNTAPSIYEYRSTSEWEAAMALWCAENEPAHKLYDYDEATDTYRPVFKSLLDLFPKQPCCPNYPKRYTAPGRAPLAGCFDHPGGSRADFRMAGITRY